MAEGDNPWTFMQDITSLKLVLLNILLHSYRQMVKVRSYEHMIRITVYVHG